MVFESESESWLERQVNRSREIVAEVVVDLVGESKNFSGIENVLRIQCALDFAHDVQELVTQLLAHVLRARDAHSVLG